MTRKNKKSNQTGRKAKTVQAQMRGPQKVPQSKRIQNGRPVSTATHHLQEVMGRRSGFGSRASKHACDNMTHPMNTGPIVVPMGYARQQTTSSYGHCPTAIVPGEMMSIRKTFQVSIGTLGFGFILLEPGSSGFGNYKNLWYSTSAYTGSTTPTAAATGVVSESAADLGYPSTNERAVFCYTAGAKMQLTRNYQTAETRSGSLHAVRLIGDGGGITLAELQENPHSSQYSTIAFDEGSLPTLICSPATTWFRFDGTGATNAVDYTSKTLVEGFVFSGTPQDAFDVTLEIKVGVYGWTVPQSVSFMPSSASIECAVSCLSQAQTSGLGHFSEDDGQVTRKVREHSETHTALTIPSGLLSSAWPVIKQLAYSGGSALLSHIVGV